MLARCCSLDSLVAFGTRRSHAFWMIHHLGRLDCFLPRCHHSSCLLWVAQNPRHALRPQRGRRNWQGDQLLLVFQSSHLHSGVRKCCCHRSCLTIQVEEIQNMDPSVRLEIPRPDDRQRDARLSPSDDHRHDVLGHMPDHAGS